MTGRNEPCPCGSGSKFKRCCGQGTQSLHRPLNTPLPDLNDLVVNMRALRYDEVERRARQLVIQHPNSGVVWKFLGVSLGMQGKEALHALEKTANLLPDDPEAHFNLGNALRVAGRLDDAAGSYRRALEIGPDFGIAHLALGDVLQARGQLEAAAASYRKALEIEPDKAEAQNDLGAVLLGLGQLPEAVTRLRRALEIKPDFAAAHTNLGNAFRNLGQLDDALACHRRALELQPGLVEAAINLGNVLRDLGQNEAAAASYRRALEIDPNLAPAHCNLGAALRDLGTIGEAESSFRQALLLQPDYAEAHSNLGVVLRLQNRMKEAVASCQKARQADPNLAAAVVLSAELHADRGQFEAAEELFKQAMKLEPNSAEAWAAVANLRKMTADDAAWLTEAQRIVGRRLPPRQESLLRYAIGKYFDDVHDYPQAFTNYQRANELTKLCTAKHDRRLVTQAVNRTIGHYGAEGPSQAAGNAIGSVRPVFVVGMPRSGTSLAEQILASHPAVYGAGELPFWSLASATCESSTADAGGRDGLMGKLGREYLQLVGDLSPGAQRVVDKMPSNFLFLGLIHAALPGACIIHMRRNPIDTCLSVYFQNFDVAHSYANDLDDLAHYYTEYLRLMKHWSSWLPEHAMMEVPYEGLVDDQEAWSRKMLEFIGLPWDSRCLDFTQTNRAVVTRSRWQVRQAISKSSVQRWRNYETFIRPLLRLEELDV
jgi:tetratricopeptide (TPR) repeat protein